jgi:hypothetical protein
MVVNIIHRNATAFAQGTKIGGMTDGVDSVAAAVAARRALEQRQATQLPVIVSQRPDAGTLDAADTGCRLGQDAQRHIQRRLAEICPPRQAGNTLLQVFGDIRVLPVAKLNEFSIEPGRYLRCSRHDHRLHASHHRLTSL